MPYNSFLKYISFGCVCLIIPILAVATFLEKVYGNQFTHDYIYVSFPLLILWGLISFFSIWYILRVKLYKQVATFCLHLSFVVILIGALLTHVTGEQGKIHLRVGDSSISEFSLSDGTLSILPFSISLKDFKLKYYEGTFSPSDFISTIELTHNGEVKEETVSMNNISSYKNYRFYQSGYDADGKGSFLSVSHDPYGIAVSYTGYLWLLVSMVLFFFQKKTLFKSILHNPLLKKGLTILFFVISTCFYCQSAPKTIPKDVADKFGNLYIYYNDRITPLNTFARDFTMKIYGNDSYNGLSPEQVLLGWFFFYDDWKNEPIIKIKGNGVKDILGIEESYARLTDFTDFTGFKLEKALQQHGTDYNNIISANEKFNLVSGVVTGSLLKLYPVKDSIGVLNWFSLTDKDMGDIPFVQWLFIRNSLDFVGEKIAMKDWKATTELIDKINKYQIKEGGTMLPGEKRFKAELFYNRFNLDKPLAMGSLTIGIFLFLFFILMIGSNKRIPNWTIRVVLGVMILIFFYLCVQLGLRWFISRHLPLSNGFETMQFMSWCCALLTIVFSHSFKLVLPFGYLLCGFTLLVAMIGESSPQITNLMPVLKSPLLSIHVMVIMLAYSLFAFTMFDGIAALLFSIGKNSQVKIEYLELISRMILYPAVFLLASGIFIGAVWANVSWGRYWGWDPKEVWALITLLIYALPLHTKSLSIFRKPLFFHWYCILAFLSVVITYFGVNFFLGGMHSYA